MIIICCYTTKDFRKSSLTVGLQMRTQQSLMGYDVSWYDVTDDDYGYWEIVNAHWGCGHDIITVEQDIVFKDFKYCSHPWCTYGYWVNGSWTDHSLGCAKFSVSLQEHTDFTKRCPWYELDDNLALDFKAFGLSPHVHGEVEHLHRYTQRPLVDRDELIKTFSKERPSLHVVPPTDS